MSVTAITIVAAVSASLATAAWLIAAYQQSRWRLLCLLVALFCGYYALIYAQIVFGVVNGVTAGQTYLRPATGGLMLLLMAIALRFWRRT